MWEGTKTGWRYWSFRTAGLLLLTATAVLPAAAQTDAEKAAKNPIAKKISLEYQSVFQFDYGRVLKGPWSFGLGVAWDREIEKPSDKPSKQINSWTLIPTITYLLNSRFSLSTGVGQGFADDDNPERKMRFKKGNLGTGVVLGISLPDMPFLERDAIGLSVSWEYTFGEKHPSISIDLAMSFGF